MPKIKPIKPAKLVRLLEQHGFTIYRQAKGSHVFLMHKNGKRVIVPVHGGKDIPTGTLLAILKDAGLDKEVLLEGKKRR